MVEHYYKSKSWIRGHCEAECANNFQQLSSVSHSPSRWHKKTGTFQLEDNTQNYVGYFYRGSAYSIHLEHACRVCAPHAIFFG